MNAIIKIEAEISKLDKLLKGYNSHESEIARTYRMKGLKEALDLFNIDSKQNKSLTKLKGKGIWDVVCCYEIGGYVEVKAKNQAEAEENAIRKIEDIGEEAFYETTNRNYFTNCYTTRRT